MDIITDQFVFGKTPRQNDEIVNDSFYNEILRFEWRDDNGNNLVSTVALFGDFKSKELYETQSPIGIYFGGNLEFINYRKTAATVSMLHHFLKIPFIVVDYPGCGKHKEQSTNQVSGSSSSYSEWFLRLCSNKKRPIITEKLCEKFSQSLYDWLCIEIRQRVRQEHKIDDPLNPTSLPMLIWARSIGCIFSAYFIKCANMSAPMTIKGIVLESPITNARDLVSNYLPFPFNIVVDLYLYNTGNGLNFQNLIYTLKTKWPETLIIHGDCDTVSGKNVVQKLREEIGDELFCAIELEDREHTDIEVGDFIDHLVIWIQRYFPHIKGSISSLMVTEDV